MLECHTLWNMWLCVCVWGGGDVMQCMKEAGQRVFSTHQHIPPVMHTCHTAVEREGRAGTTAPHRHTWILHTLFAAVDMHVGSVLYSIMTICWKHTHPQVTKDVDDFVSSWNRFHYITCTFSEMFHFWANCCFNMAQTCHIIYKSTWKKNDGCCFMCDTLNFNFVLSQWIFKFA